MCSSRIFCPRVFCVVARSSCFYRLRAFMLCLVLCGTQLVYFIGCVLSCCHVLCEHVAFEYFYQLHVRVLFDTWLVICFAGHMLVFFCVCKHMAFVLVFCVPCALMSIVWTPPILFPDYWLICPTCFSSFLSSFAPFIISLYLYPFIIFPCCVLILLAWPGLALPCPAKPASCPVFPVRGSFSLFVLFIIQIKPIHL